jgi:hypothetical protein
MISYLDEEILVCFLLSLMYLQEYQIHLHWYMVISAVSTITRQMTQCLVIVLSKENKSHKQNRDNKLVVMLMHLLNFLFCPYQTSILKFIELKADDQLNQNATKVYCHSLWAVWGPVWIPRANCYSQLKISSNPSEQGANRWTNLLAKPPNS